jgi:hypothetical protein
VQQVGRGGPGEQHTGGLGKVSVDGLANTLDAGTVMAVVYPLVICQATTSSPIAPLPEASSVADPSAVTTPATS